jgi:hypothetical protein
MHVHQHDVEVAVAEHGQRFLAARGHHHVMPGAPHDSAANSWFTGWSLTTRTRFFFSGTVSGSSM